MPAPWAKNNTQRIPPFNLATAIIGRYPLPRATLFRLTAFSLVDKKARMRRAARTPAAHRVPDVRPERLCSMGCPSDSVPNHWYPPTLFSGATDMAAKSATQGKGSKGAAKKAAPKATKASAAKSTKSTKAATGKAAGAKKTPARKPAAKGGKKG
ncbi:MAG: hypothetical protein WD066_00450 [Planctomycetaceae bacterium]